MPPTWLRLSAILANSQEHSEAIMSFLSNPLRLTADEVVKYVLALDKKALRWAPVGVTWHNAGMPNLKTWAGYPENVKEAWGRNYDFYCHTTQHWHSGPHGMGTPDGWAFILCDLLADGVHASCFNHDHFGFETVGDFSSSADDPLTGPGLAAMQSTTNLIAAICAWLGFDPDKAINFHRECARDGHPCPGSRVTDIAAKSMVRVRLAEIKGLPVPVAPAPVAASAPIAALGLPAPPTDPYGRAKWIQSFLNAHGAHVDVDGDLGPSSQEAVADYLAKHAA